MFECPSQTICAGSPGKQSLLHPTYQSKTFAAMVGRMMNDRQVFTSSHPDAGQAKKLASPQKGLEFYKHAVKR